MGKRKKGAGGGGEDSGGGRRVKVYLHAVTNDEATLLKDNGNTRPLQEVKKQSRASEVQLHQNQCVTGMKIIIIRGTPKQIEKAVSLINQKTGSQETISDQAQKFWLQWVEAAFPDLDSRAYFLPPVYFNRVAMTRQTVSGEYVLMLNTHHGQSSQSNQPTPHEGVEGSSEQELTRHTCPDIQPTLPEDEYQDTQPTLPEQTVQCIQPTPAEQPCNSNQRTPPEHFSQVSQLTPDYKASCSNFMAPPEQAGNYKQAASRRQEDQCIQLTLPREFSHYNDTSHNHNDQSIQTPPGQADQSYQTSQPKLLGQYNQLTQPTQADEYIQTTPWEHAGQYNQLTQPGHTGQHIQVGPPVHTSQYKQTIPNVQDGQHLQATATGRACQYIPSPPGQDRQGNHSYPPGQTGQTSHEQRIELQASSSDVVQPSVHQPPKVLESDVRDDAAKQRVLVCLQEFSEQNKEVLVGMSQLHFGQYLGEPVYAAATEHLPRPQNIPKTSSNTTQTNITQGSYDVLLIHRHYGLVICEVKAFGDNTHTLNMSQQDIDNNIRKKLTDAVSQLDKAEAMLSHLVSDIAPGLRITKTIAFPNLTADQVKQAISGDSPLIEALCRCLGTTTTTTNPAAITSVCLCRDQLSDPKTPCDVSSHVLGELGHWWQRRVAGAGPDSHMTDVVYKMLVARKYIQTFCEKLLTQVPRLHLWAASCYHRNCPPGWQVEYLTRPLRSPAAVVREVKKDTIITKVHSIKKYSERGVPDHTDGPPVRRVYHRGQGHSGVLPDACVTCGREVASFLHSLRVGVTENNEVTTLNTGTTATGGTTPACLQWRDVLVLYWEHFSSLSGILKGLEEAGIPVLVMQNDNIEDVATACSDVVWVARADRVHGLERKVVVWAQDFERGSGFQYDDWEKYLSPELYSEFRSVRFHAISRCTSQLVIVENQSPPEPASHSPVTCSSLMSVP